MSVLAYLFVAQTEQDVAYAAKELEGSVYFAALRTELGAVIALSQGTGSAADVAKAQAEVLRLDADKAEKMAAADAAAKAAEAVRAVQQQPKDAPTAAYDGPIDAILDHIVRVQDGSNLTLDPVLDSYYVQDLVTVKMPAVVVGAGRALEAALAMVAAIAVEADETSVVAVSAALERRKLRRVMAGGLMDEGFW